MCNSLYKDSMLNDDYLPIVKAYYFKEWNGYDMKFHSHDRVEVMYVVNGKCTVITENTSYCMKSGDFIVIDSNIVHRLSMKKDEICRMLNVEFGFDKKVFSDDNALFYSIRNIAISSNSFSAMLKKKLPVIVLNDTDEVYHILKTLVIELGNADIDKDFIVNSLLTQLFIRIARLETENGQSSFSSSSIWVKKAVEYIHNNYDFDISVNDISETINIHPGYLQRIFKANTGSTIIEYITSLRINKAKMLLENTDIPIIDIANYIGISSRQYFTYIFKKHTGFSPFEFRKSLKKKETKS